MRKNGLTLMAVALSLFVALTIGTIVCAQAQASSSVNLYALDEYENKLGADTVGAEYNDGKVILSEYFSGHIKYSNDYLDAKEFFVNSADEYVNGDSLDFVMQAKIQIDSIMIGSQNNGLGLYLGTRGNDAVFVKLQANGKVFVNAYNQISQSVVANIADGRTFTMKIEKSIGNITVYVDDTSMVQFAANDLSVAPGLYTHYTMGVFSEVSFVFSEQITVDPPTEDMHEWPVWETDNTEHKANTEYVDPPVPTAASTKKSGGCGGALDANGTVAAIGFITLALLASGIIIRNKKQKGERK